METFGDCLPDFFLSKSSSVLQYSFIIPYYDRGNDESYSSHLEKVDTIPLLLNVLCALYLPRELRVSDLWFARKVGEPASILAGGSNRLVHAAFLLAMVHDALSSLLVFISKFNTPLIAGPFSLAVAQTLGKSVPVYSQLLGGTYSDFVNLFARNFTYQIGVK